MGSEFLIGVAVGLFIGLFMGSKKFREQVTGWLSKKKPTIANKNSKRIVLNYCSRCGEKLVEGKCSRCGYTA